jgi:hypothetical protein
METVELFIITLITITIFNYILSKFIKSKKIQARFVIYSGLLIISSVIFFDNSLEFSKIIYPIIFGSLFSPISFLFFYVRNKKASDKEKIKLKELDFFILIFDKFIEIHVFKQLLVLVA